jgi:hypothetical protein
VAYFSKSANGLLFNERRQTVLLPQMNREAAVASYLAALREVAGYEGQTESDVTGWPLLQFGHGHRTVQICVSFIHLPGQVTAAVARDDMTRSRSI